MRKSKYPCKCWVIAMLLFAIHPTEAEVKATQTRPASSARARPPLRRGIPRAGHTATPCMTLTCDVLVSAQFKGVFDCTAPLLNEKSALTRVVRLTAASGWLCISYSYSSVTLIDWARVRVFLKNILFENFHGKFQKNSKISKNI